MCKRKRGSEKERKRSWSLFFRNVVKWKCSLPGEGLFFSLSLLLFYYYVLAVSLVHSRGFSERDNWVRWKRSFHSIFLLLHTHAHSHTYTHINILREIADTLCALFDLLWLTSTRWYQLLSAGNNNKHLIILTHPFESFYLFFSPYYSTIIPHVIGGVYGGASTIQARLLPFVNLEASYFNALLSNTGSDLYPLAWWRYPYSHYRTSVEFQSLANEYERNLKELELDLSDANVDNALLEAEYIILNDFLFVYFHQKNVFSLLDSNRHGTNLLMNELNQQMKKSILMLNCLIYDYGK